MPRGVYKRKPRSAETNRRQSETMLEKSKDPIYRKNVSDGIKRSYETTDRRARLKEQMQELAKDPNWLRNVSEGTKEALNQPDVKAKHLAGLKRSVEEHGCVFDRVGRGRPPQTIMLEFAAVLCPVGYLMDTICIPTETRGAYILDFGHPEAKVDIEIDGSSHKYKKDHDEKRDTVLRSLGWKVIRIKV